MNVFPLDLPPLRDHKAEIPLLVKYFVRKFTQQMDKSVEYIPDIPDAVMETLRRYSWPGNVRELQT